MNAFGNLLALAFFIGRVDAQSLVRFREGRLGTAAHQQRVSVVVELRGGGGGGGGGGAVSAAVANLKTLVTSKENILSVFLANYFLIGAIGMAAPEKLAEESYYSSSSSNDQLKEGSFAHLCYELVGSGCLSLATATHLARSSSSSPEKSPHEIVAISSIPFAFVTFRHFLKNTPSKLGLRKGMWELLMAHYFLGIELILAKQGDIELISKVFVLVPAIIGIAGMLDLSYSKAIWGVEFKDGGTTEVAIRWLSRITVQCGVLFFSLLQGVPIMKAAGFVALAYAIQCVDFAFLTKDRDYCPKQPKWLMQVYMVFWTVVGAALLRG